METLTVVLLCGVVALLCVIARSLSALAAPARVSVEALDEERRLMSELRDSMQRVWDRSSSRGSQTYLVPSMPSFGMWQSMVPRRNYPGYDEAVKRAREFLADIRGSGDVVG